MGLCTAEKPRAGKRAAGTAAVAAEPAALLRAKTTSIKKGSAGGPAGGGFSPENIVKRMQGLKIKAGRTTDPITLATRLKSIGASNNDMFEWDDALGDDDDDERYARRPEDEDTAPDYMLDEEHCGQRGAYWKRKALIAHNHLCTKVYNTPHLPFWSARMYLFDPLGNRWAFLGPVLAHIPPSDAGRLIVNRTVGKHEQCLNMRIPEFFDSDRFVLHRNSRNSIVFSTIQHNYVNAVVSAKELRFMSEFCTGYDGLQQVSWCAGEIKPVKDLEVKTVALRFRETPNPNATGTGSTPSSPARGAALESPSEACSRFREALSFGTAYNRHDRTDQRRISFATSPMAREPAIPTLAAKGFAWCSSYSDTAVRCEYCGALGTIETVKHISGCVFL
ncbi:hypothetical protein HDU87_004114 [Geranomyces variabilis]|uniref:Uncharacterized protein n=1 Tax=Geranomyces variabilis TaxID=109894 RepID=A0AAD5XVP2_9FUNG|nr:hypothetical protein HDU87_004114 [Geranomyces variabilis]